MTEPTLFGLLILDREPFAYADFWGLLQAWLQDAGGFAAVGLAVYLLYALLTPPAQAESAKSRAGVSAFMLLMAVLALACYVAYGFLLFTGKGVDVVNRTTFNPDPTAFVKYEPPKFSWNLQPLALMAGGLFALLGIGQPFVASLARIRFRRIWALSKLGFKEAVRSRMFWVFLLFLLPFLFPIKWFFPIKPEDELRAIVVFTSFWMVILLLLPAALLAAFSIPNDIKNQNLYTVITKPVQRFEIVLGRFVGYTFLMSLALIAMTGASLVLISFTNLDEKAREETYKARVPLRGKLEFRSRVETRGEQFVGTNVGREFDYRKYIGGHPASSQRAVWNFGYIPRGMAAGNAPVPCEFTFDIFRLTKGEENRGVDISVQVVSWQCPLEPPLDPREGAWRWKDPERERQYLTRAEELIRNAPNLSAQAGRNPAAVLALARPPKPGEAPSAAWTVVDKLAEEFGYYEVRSKEIFDYHPDSIEIPTGLFKNALSGQPKPIDGKSPPLVQVFVKCETKGQMLGMAEGDLYLLEGEQPFALNYLKAAIGLWCRVAIVIGLAVTCSTYLSGVISFLLTVFLFLAGYAAEHLQDLASGHSSVGGPFRSMNQILRAEGPTAQPDPGSSLVVAADSLDKLFSWGVRRFINLVPDVYAYSWTDFVKEGFNIPLESLLMNLVVMAGYLLPWFILGYFLFRSREVAA